MKPVVYRWAPDLGKAGLRRQAASLLLLSLCFLPLFRLQAAALPKCAVSAPAGVSPAEAAAAAEKCGGKESVLVLPPVSLNLSEDPTPGAFEAAARIVGAMPETGSAFLRVAVKAGALTGQEPESTITARVGAYLRQAPLAPPAVRGILIELEESPGASNLWAFSLVSLAVSAKGAKPDLQVAFAFPSGFIARHGGLVKRLATYSDLMSIAYTRGWEEEAAWVGTQALNRPIIVRLGASGAGVVAYLSNLLAVTEKAEMVWSEPGDGQAMAALCEFNARLRSYIGQDLSPVPAGNVGFRAAVEGAAPAEQKWFTSGRLQETVAVIRTNGKPGGPKAVRMEGTAAGQFEVQWYDPLTGARLQGAAAAGAEKMVRQTAASESEFVLVKMRQLGNAEERVYTAVEVKERADLSVEEIIARWQQYREKQRQLLENVLAVCFMNLHFEPTSLGSGFDISMRFKQFANRAGLLEWAQTEFYVNGVKFSNKREFPLPQLQPEKVMTQPLELKLNEKYRYKLLGTEQVSGVFCYVVEIAPAVQGETLYSGKVWIDGTTFRQVKQFVTQRGEKSNVISNLETQNFELVPDGKGNQFNLLKSITAQQLLNAAGRDFVLQKTYQFSDYSINSPEFDSALAATRASDLPMFRDTAGGLRSLRKQNDQRVEENRNQKRVRSIVGGIMYDGSYNFPIPIAGISLVDFNFRNTGSQLSVFFAGPILAANVSRQYGKKFRVGVDLAVSALPGNNRVYRGDSEVKTETLWEWQEDTGMRATWQATTSLSLTAAGYLSYERFRGNSDVDKLYILPRNGVTLLPTAELKFARRGYIFAATTTRGQRLGWRRFGYAAQPEPFYSGFTQYSADMGKTLYIGKFTKAGWDFGYYGGNQLDRFSRYRPSFFSRPRINGLPSGTDSFDAVAIGSVNYGFNVMDFIKFEGVYSYARARNLIESRRFKKFDGAQFKFGTAGPFGTYLQGTISYALHGNVPRYNSRWGAQVMVFKPLR